MCEKMKVKVNISYSSPYYSKVSQLEGGLG
jgi:hypothetical protein